METTGVEETSAINAEPAKDRRVNLGSEDLIWGPPRYSGKAGEDLIMAREVKGHPDFQQCCN